MIDIDDYKVGIREEIQGGAVVTTGLVAHPLADRFPMLPDDELHRLAEDIRENGLQNPIIVDDSGRILDGRNRAAACKLAGVEPTVESFEGADEEAAAFVLSQNVSRRHMTTGQQAMSTALVLADTNRRKNGKWAYGALANDQDPDRSGRAWKMAMAQAGAILDHAPDIAEQVVNGGMALDAAYKEAERRRDVERRNLEEQERLEAEEADTLKFLQETAPDYAEKIGAGYGTARQAKTAWEDDHRKEAARLRQEQRAREDHERKMWETHRDLYQAIGTAVATLSSYLNHDIPELMERFEPGMLTPNIQRTFTGEHMNAALKVLERLKEWKSNA